jgi:hypothetical protein
MRAKPQHDTAATIRIMVITPKYPDFFRAGEYCCGISMTISRIRLEIASV